MNAELLQMVLYRAIIVTKLQYNLFTDKVKLCDIIALSFYLLQ